MLQELTNGNYYCYRLFDGGLGIVKAGSPAEALSKVRDAYKKHSNNTDYEGSIEVSLISDCAWFEDVPDVVEIYEYLV